MVVERKGDVVDELNIAEEFIGDRYQVVQHLGAGAMGSVYLASDTQLNRQVALKVLKGEWVSRPEVAKRLEMECQLMAQLGPHNNIVTLFDRISHGDAVVLVIEYVAGENVADVLDRTREMNRESESSRKTTPALAGVSTIAITPDDAIDITLQCLSGLDFAHSRGVIHRDIKPANIMVSRDHNGNIVAKITDFGIGKAIAGLDGETAPAMTALTRAGGPGPGTPAYMAPEQIDQARFGDVGPASDLYALGVTLYEMLSLGLPFHGTYTELLHLHTNVEAPDLRKAIPGLSPKLAAVVRKSLAKEQKDRYESAHRFRLELAAATQAGMPAWSPETREDTRSKAPLLFGAIAAVALSAGGYFYLAGDDVKKDDPVAVESGSQAGSTSETPESPVTSGVAPETPKPVDSAVVANTPPMPESVPGNSVPAPASGGAPTAPMPTVAPPQAAPVAPAAAPGASVLAAKNSAESARTSAVARFNGQPPSNNADFSQGQAWLDKANAAEAAGDYDAARSYLLQARQGFDGAKPAPPAPKVVAAKSVPKPAPAPAPAPAAVAPAPAPVVKAPDPKPDPAPAAPSSGGGFKAGKSKVTHTTP